MGAELTLLQETLQCEFCPPLDPPLLAALLVDATDNGELSLTDAQADTLRSTLKELAAQAELDEQQLSAQISDFHLSDRISGGSSSSDSRYGDGAGVTTSCSSISSQLSFGSPLGFLQATLPHISIERLKSAIDRHGVVADELDMAAVVETLLTEDYVLELEERGLDGLDEDNDLEQFLDVDETSWQIVKSKQRIRESGSIQKSRRQRNKRATTITLGDVRQTTKRSASTQDDRRAHAVTMDPWNQVSSLCTHIASLLRPHPPSYFQSYFHSPNYRTPYDALLAALTALREKDDDDPDRYANLLPVMLDILTPSYEDLDTKLRLRLVSETQLALDVTRGRGGDALDIVSLLRDLDLDFATDRLEMGIYHSPPPVSTSPVLLTKHLETTSPKLVSSPNPNPPPLTVDQESDPFQWQFVPYRKARRDDTTTLAASIPSYNRSLLSSKTKFEDNETLSQAQKRRKQIRDRMRSRNQFLRQASDAWQKGNSRTRGGEVAIYYAQRARESHDAARKESLEASRLMVESKRMASHDGSIDLHGITSAEAVIIVKDILRTAGTSLRHSEKPLKIITGRGNHSLNKVSVLKPAVKNALVEDGWVVDTWDGGLFVRGKRGRSR